MHQERSSRRGVRRAVIGVVAITASLVASLAVASTAGAETVPEVTTQQELAAAVADASVPQVRLGDDIAVTCTGDGGVGTATRAAASDLVIDGGGHTLTQQCAGVPVIAFGASPGSATLTLRAITITGAKTDGWAGAVSVYGSVVLERVVITGNASGAPWGAAVGAFRDATVRNSRFDDNVGGGLSSAFGTVDVRDSQFRRNTGTGVFAPDGPKVTVQRSRFERNEQGGIVGYYAVTAIDSAFVNNSKPWSGGAISADYDNGVVYALRSAFQGNTAYRGGAILAGNRVVAMSSTFRNNHATVSGGAIDVITTGNPLVPKGSVRLRRVTMDRNPSSGGAQLASQRLRYDLDVKWSTFVHATGDTNCANADVTADSGRNRIDDGSCG